MFFLFLKIKGDKFQCLWMGTLRRHRWPTWHRLIKEMICAWSLNQILLFKERSYISIVKTLKKTLQKYLIFFIKTLTLNRDLILYSNIFERVFYAYLDWIFRHNTFVLVLWLGHMKLKKWCNCIRIFFFLFFGSYINNLCCYFE